MIRINFRCGAWYMALAVFVFSFSCKEKAPVKNFTLKNPLSIDRFETISVPAAQVQDWITQYGAAHVIVKDGDHPLVSQWLDLDGDGTFEELIFQTSLTANQEKNFSLTIADDTVSHAADSIRAYSRFVPERTDDYTWENDRVAFRTYGPVAQQMVEKGEPGGTLSSGMDCWLKKVPYSVIDKWYAKNVEEVGYYHIDHGEGYDPYHVGSSRGCGGVGVWQGDTLYVSKNFVSYRRLANGPIRTVFELTYAPWSAGDVQLQETKTISLDLGSNLSRFDVAFKSDGELPAITTGITLHEKEGDIKIDANARFIRYDELIDEAAFYTGIVLAPGFSFDGHQYITETPDQSHVFITTTPIEGKVSYYAGFSWEKSKQFDTVAAWDDYLTNVSQRIATPVQILFEQK